MEKYVTQQYITGTEFVAGSEKMQVLKKNKAKSSVIGFGTEQKLEA